MFVLMATGGLLVTANAGPMAQVVGLRCGADARRDAEPARQRRGARLLGLGLGSARTREHDGLHLRAAGDLSALGRATRTAVGSVVRGDARAVYFTWGQIYSLFPSTSGDYFGTRHATSNYAVLYTAKGVASIIGGWVGALLFERSGSWAMGFYGSAVMALVAAVLAVRAARLAGDREGQGAGEDPGNRRDRDARARRELAAAYADRRHSCRPVGARYRPSISPRPTRSKRELVRMRRRRAGRTTVGVKVGYANKAVWRVLKLDTLVWAHMYDDTVAFADAERGLAVARADDRAEDRAGDRLQDESAARRGRTEAAAALEAVEWLALGFEIIDCRLSRLEVSARGFRRRVRPARRAHRRRAASGRRRRRSRRSSSSCRSSRCGSRRTARLVEEGSGRNSLRSPALCLAELASAIARQTPPRRSQLASSSARAR